MNISLLRLRWILLALSVLMVISACKLAGGGVTIQFGASATPIPTNTPEPTATFTPAPTNTPAPTPTFTPLPLPTQPPAAPTPINASAQPTPGLENTSGKAQVKITNSLGVSIKVTLIGPEQRSFTIRGQGSMEVELEAGTYNFTIIAQGYYPLNGSRTFQSGENTWQIVK